MDLQTILDKSRWLLFCVALLAVLVFVVALMHLPNAAVRPRIHSKKFEWPSVLMPSADLWKAIERTRGARAETHGLLSKRFRLAGTFFAFGNADTHTARRAIIDDLQTGIQKLVREKDQIADVEVVSIFQDRVVLRAEGKEEELWLGFTENETSSMPANIKPATSATQEKTLSTSRFGRRVGESRWVLSRKKLMGYYQEMLDDPERLASIYLSLKPDRNEKRRIKGYYLDPEGEREFFDAMGLKEGDIIRKVNSMKMTSQARAEYFLGEFVKKRMNALVLDIERDQKEGKLIYLIR